MIKARNPLVQQQGKDIATCRVEDGLYEATVIMFLLIPTCRDLEDRLMSYHAVRQPSTRIHLFDSPIGVHSKGESTLLLLGHWSLDVGPQEVQMWLWEKKGEVFSEHKPMMVQTASLSVLVSEEYP